MTHEEFLKWLDEQIQGVENWKTMGGDPYFFVERDTALKNLRCVREKYLSILPPLQSTN